MRGGVHRMDPKNRERRNASSHGDGRVNVNVRRGTPSSHYRAARSVSADGDTGRRTDDARSAGARAGRDSRSGNAARTKAAGRSGGSARVNGLSRSGNASRGETKSRSVGVPPAVPQRREGSRGRIQNQRNNSVTAVTRYGITAKDVVRRVANFTENRLDRRRERIIEGNEQRLLVEKQRNAGIVRTRSGVDRPMLVLVLVLLALGTVAVFSASYPAAIADGLNAMYYVKKQLIFVALGASAMAVTTAIPYTVYKNMAPAAFGLVTLLLCAVPFIGIDYQGTKRWIGIPGTDINVQPSELMKIAIVLILAWYFDKYREKVTDRLKFRNTFFFGEVFPALFVGVACGLVIIEKHLSATAIIAAIGISVMLIGGSHVGWTAGGSIAAGAAAFGIYIKKNPYAANRVNTALDENANVLAEKWQTTQGLLAIGSGGLFGVGLGSGRLKYSYVSEAHTDFIFTIWCEETGFVGAVLVILLYLAFIWRGFRIAMHAPDTFSALLVYGLTAHVGIQAFLNILVVTDNMFNTGVSLPFFSYGGSSLMVLLAEMGMILSVSKHSFQKR